MIDRWIRRLMMEPEQRSGGREEPVEIPADATLLSVWELFWGLFAIAFVGLWMKDRADGLRLAIDLAEQQAPGQAILKRLTTDELSARLNWLHKLNTEYEQLVEPISWSRVLVHISQTIPDGTRILQLKAAAGQMGTRRTLRLTTADPEMLLTRLRSEPYINGMLPEVTVVDGPPINPTPGKPASSADLRTSVVVFASPGNNPAGAPRTAPAEPTLGGQPPRGGDR